MGPPGRVQGAARGETDAELKALKAPQMGLWSLHPQSPQPRNRETLGLGTLESMDVRGLEALNDHAAVVEKHFSKEKGTVPWRSNGNGNAFGCWDVMITEVAVACYLMVAVPGARTWQ